jgi:PAS domain S-box-containing protein
VNFSILSALIGIAGGLVWLLFQYWRFNRKLKRLRNKSAIQQVEIDHLQIYKTVVQNSPDLFVIVDQSLQVLVANKAAAQFGWTASRTFLEADLSETSKLHFEFAIKKVLQEDAPTNGEIRMTLMKHNSWKFYKYHIFPIHGPHNEILGVTVTALDVTAQREAEDELIRQREFAEGIMNAIPDAIYVKDDEKKFLYGNKSFSEMVGQNSSEYRGLRHEEIFPDSTAKVLKKSDSNVFREDTPFEIEEELVNFQGKKWTVISKRIPFIFQNGQRVLIAIMRDFSERKRLEKELQISQARQEEASRLATLGEAASGIAHEINNPLNIIIGVAELMKEKVEKEGQIYPAKLLEYCDIFIKYTMRIAKIIKGLRSISRDASSDPFTEISLNNLLDETLELCQQQFVYLGIKLITKLSDEEITVEGRFSQLSQIVMNLLNNAKDAVEGFKEATIHVEIRQEGGYGVVRVWDSGNGIAEEIENKIMNPFFTTKPVGKGTGLGLSISNSIALEHKGFLVLNRKVAASCFELHIPLLSSSMKQSA